MVVCAFDNNNLFDYMGKSSQSLYLLRYLDDLKAKTVVVEDKYIDKDYLIDYSNFYSRSFEEFGRYTTRLHFFSASFSPDDFKTIFDPDEDFIKLLKESYLGFVVVKPIKKQTQNGSESLIGRTVLKTYSQDDGGEHRYFITDRCSASLYGIPLTIESLPFQAQDTAVAACATTALWTSLYPLNVLFGTQKYSPFEITQASVSYPEMSRNFPSTGLTFYQMKNYFNLVDLETEVIKIDNSSENMNDNFIQDAIKAYLKCGLPIIAGIKLVSERRASGYHAVVVSGYRYDKNGDLKELYVHDDQIGPYSRVLSRKYNEKFSHWDNTWTNEYGYDDIVVETLLIPLYPKIRLSFSYIYTEFLRTKNSIPTEFNAEFFLTDVNSYKQFLALRTFERKEDILTKFFPKFLWIIRVNVKEKPIIDLIYDATSVNINKIESFVM